MKHESQLIRILRSPMIIGIKPIVIAKEVKFFDQNRVVAEPDILALTAEGIINIEYKSTDQTTKARNQLRLQEKFIRKLGYRGKIRNLYIVGDFEVRELLTTR